ncbi:MAG: AMP-dependent synthetase/ligase [Myxococcales bacterium]
MVMKAVDLERVMSARNLVELVLLKGENPGAVGAKHKINGQWRDVTWGEILLRVRRISESLAQLGIGSGDRVAIFAPTRLDWCISHFAIMGVGAVAVPIYASNTPAEAEFVINNSGARAVFFDGDAPDGKQAGRWSRLKEVRARLTTVEHYVAFDLPSKPEEGLTGLADLEKQGAEVLAQHPRGLEERAATMGIDDLSVIIYTSGTTGNPKGVMLTHGNWVYQARMVATLNLMTGSDVVLLFLPLAHSFAMVVQFAWLAQPFQMAFAESIERLVDNAAEVGATVLPAVPRIFEKAYAKVVADGSSAPGVKGRLFRWAMGEFEEYVAARNAGREYHSLQWSLAKRLVFSKVQERLNARFGGRMRLFISGSAPLSRKIHYFFDLCGLTILEGYGLTETAAPTHVNRPGAMRIGTVGPALPETEVRLAPEDKEILVRGPQVMKG